MIVLLTELKSSLRAQVGGAAVALECAGRELQIRVNLEEQDDGEEPKEGEDEKLIEEERENDGEKLAQVACRPKRVQFSPWTPVRGSL